MTRRFLLALAFSVSLVAGGLVVLHASQASCSCKTMHWGVWDWEYWYYECYDPPPPECSIG